jgi:hypothetical protein
LTLIPAINGHGTARAVAGFYQLLATGVLLSPGMLAEAGRDCLGLGHSRLKIAWRRDAGEMEIVW